MLFYFGHHNDAAYNIALERYFLTSNLPDLCFIYQNRPSVICGQFQNINAEFNHNILFKNKVSLARRLSGGGTVYHDMGNLNYSFICNRRSGLNYYNVFNEIVTNVLREIGCRNVKVQLNNLFCEDYKISGTAQYKSKYKILHHGTLLINSDLSFINDLLSNRSNYSSKAIKSVNAQIANISSFINEISTTKIIKLFHMKLKKYFESSEEISFIDIDESRVNKLVSYYGSNEWIYGNSPFYIYSNCKDLKNKVFLKVRNGKIIYTELLGLNSKFRNKLMLLGKYHNYATIFDEFSKHADLNSICIDKREIIKLFFN